MSDFYNFLRNNVRMMGNFLQRIGIELFEGLSEPYDLWIIAITLMPQQGERHAHFSSSCGSSGSGRDTSGR